MFPLARSRTIPTHFIYSPVALAVIDALVAHSFPSYLAVGQLVADMHARVDVVVPVVAGGEAVGMNHGGEEEEHSGEFHGVGVGFMMFGVVRGCEVVDGKGRDCIQVSTVGKLQIVEILAIV